jgi:amidase
LRGPLHGIPVLVKDNIATDDQMETTAGSLALVGSRVAHERGWYNPKKSANMKVADRTTRKNPKTTVRRSE